MQSGLLTVHNSSQRLAVLGSGLAGSVCVNMQTGQPCFFVDSPVQNRTVKQHVAYVLNSCSTPRVQ
jgi:hypothetical protein